MYLSRKQEEALWEQVEKIDRIDRHAAAGTHQQMFAAMKASFAMGYQEAQFYEGRDQKYYHVRDLTRRFEKLLYAYGDVPLAGPIGRLLYLHHPGSMNPWNKIYDAVEEHLKMMRQVLQTGYRVVSAQMAADLAKPITIDLPVQPVKQQTMFEKEENSHDRE